MFGRQLKSVLAKSMKKKKLSQKIYAKPTLLDLQVTN